MYGKQKAQGKNLETVLRKFYYLYFPKTMSLTSCK